ncbi:hypothetical protein [Bradyrhizobium sp. DASA03007]|uniref:hypothetical protein n=1 Tax=unclassified Bradyrhizobium TaxID=2631580 RepID=UPI003F72D61F
MFYLVRLDRDADNNLVETPLPDYGLFDKGADAAKASKDAATKLGAKVQCRRKAQAGDWRATIQAKLESGELTPLPKKWDLPPITDHFAHLWANDPSMIAYIESEDNGIIQKFTAIKPGRYITAYYEGGVQGSADITDARRRTLIAAIDPSGEIFYARTPEEIEYVYKNGPDSCMDGDHNFNGLPMWPTGPYGAGDLAVAYTKNNRGRIQSRALCWPEKKLHGRCYGAVEAMRTALANEGYIDLREGTNAKKNVFVGARLLKVPHGDAFVMPYFDDITVAIDKGDYFETVEARENSDHWVTSSSSGLAYIQALCPKLNIAVQVREMRYVHGADELWSASAIQRHAFTCDGSGKTWPKTEIVILGDGQRWSKEYFAEHGETCSVNGQHWPKSELIEKKPGKWVHRLNADYDEVDLGPKEPPKKPRSRKKIIGIDPASGPDRTAIATLSGNTADGFIVDEVQLLDPNQPTVNDLLLNRRRRAA